MEQSRDDSEQEYKDLVSNPFVSLFQTTEKAVEYCSRELSERQLALPTTTPDICLKNAPTCGSAVNVTCQQEDQSYTQELNDLFQRVFLITISAGSNKLVPFKVIVNYVYYHNLYKLFSPVVIAAMLVALNKRILMISFV